MPRAPPRLTVIGGSRLAAARGQNGTAAAHGEEMLHRYFIIFHMFFTQKKHKC